MSKTHLIYEVTGTDLEPPEDRQTAVLLIGTTHPVDLALHIDRESLERLRSQIARALSAMPPNSDQA